MTCFTVYIRVDIIGNVVEIDISLKPSKGIWKAKV